MRFLIGQWLVIGVLLGILVALWENVVNLLNIGLAWKLWLLAVLGWTVSNILLLSIYWLCLMLMTKQEGKLTGYNLILWAIAETCYDISLSLTYKLFLHRVTPIPLLKLYGFKCGKNFSLSIHGWIVDPNLVVFGDNCRVGGETVVSGHAVEGKHVYRKRVMIGDNVEVGAKSIVAPGAQIKDNVILGAQSFVPKDACLRENTIYVGVPAKSLRKRNLQQSGDKEEAIK